MKKSVIIVMGIILASFAIGIYFYPLMPENVASHWNAQGNVDDYMPKFWGLFLMPLALAGLSLFFLSIPKIDPLKENIEKFRKYYDGLIVILALFLFYVYFLIIIWNVGVKFNMAYVLMPAIAVLFYYIGILLDNSKKNWFIGIRTPWTLSDDKVWDKTHKIGGRLFKACAIVAIFGLFFSNYAILFMVIPVILTSIYTFIYSFFEYKKIKNKE
ncbi:SdpI family protein [Patescibacteria group bacterium]|nr:SdpI family protein [Patescibacteria group bacterium]